MPNWKKLITSGSDASLSSLSLSGISGQSSEKTSLMINGDGVIGTRELGSLAFSSATYNNYTLPAADATTRGGIELFSSTPQSVAANTVSTTANRTYGLQVNSAGQGVVNIPWTNNDTTYSTATASTLGLVKIGFTESGKNYPVELSSGKMFVNVPWSNTNTQLTDADIAAFGYIKKNTDTQDLSINGQILSLTDGGSITLPDTNTQLTDAEIAAFGYIKTASDTNTQNTYSTSVVSSSGIKLRLTGAGHNGATTDDVKFVGAGATTVSRTDASTITITSTDTNTDTNTQRSDSEIISVIGKNVNPVVSATVSNDTTTFTKQDGSTFALTTSDANNNTVTSIRKDNAGTYRTGNINLVGGDNVTIAEKATGEFTISSTDTNTDTNTQRSDEEIRDVAAAQWVNGTNTTVVKSDSANTIKINSVNTTYSVGDGQLSQKNFTTALKDKLDAIPFVQDNDNIDIGTETIMSVYTSPWNAVFFDYVVMKDGNMRAGTVTAVNDGTNVEFIETSTADLGDTSDVKLFCDIDTDSMRFRATVRSNNWKVKVLPRMI